MSLPGPPEHARALPPEVGVVSRRQFLAAGLLLGLVGCEALKDPEPFTQTIEYLRGTGGRLTVSPLTLRGDTSFGEIQVVNQSGEKHGFAIDELAVYEEIPAGQQKTVTVQEAKDDETYRFYCHLKGHENEFNGTLVIDYVAEQER